MKLHAKYILVLQHRGVRQRICARGQSDRNHGCVVAVREVKIRRRTGVRQQLRRVRTWSNLNLIPSHVGNAHVAVEIREAPNLARIETEARKLRRFLAPFKKRLQAEADAEKRNAHA